MLTLILTLAVAIPAGTALLWFAQHLDGDAAI